MICGRALPQSAQLRIFEYARERRVRYGVRACLLITSICRVPWITAATVLYSADVVMSTSYPGPLRVSKRTAGFW